MIFEMAVHRGVTVWIDGKKPDKSWSCGEDEQSLDCEDLKVGDLEITKIVMEGEESTDDRVGIEACYVFSGTPITPKSITLHTNKGIYNGEITHKVIESSDSGDDVQVVMLENGEEYEIDECTIFFKATFDFQVGNPS